MSTIRSIKFSISQELPLLPDSSLEYPWVARNRDGMLMAFANPPVRDYDEGVWIDSVDKSYGEIIPFPHWDVSVTETKYLVSTREAFLRRGTKEKQYENAEAVARKIQKKKLKTHGGRNVDA
jgi:hypothetical protein